MKKTFIFRVLMLFVFIFTIMLTGCSHIADENGEEDISLVHITDEIILRDSYGSLSTGSCNSTLNTSDYTKYTIKINKFSGVEDLEDFDVYDTMELQYEYIVSSGNLRVVLLKDDRIYKDLVNEMHEYSGSVILDAGEYEIVIAGESVKFEISFKFMR